MLFFDSRTKACTLCARGEFTPLRASPRHKRRGCDTALRAKCFSQRTRRREKQIKSYSRRCGTANSVRLFRMEKAKPFPCDLFPHLQLSAVHDIAERPRGRLRDGKGEPCVVQTDEREQSEHRQQAENLPRQRDGKAPAAAADRLKERRHDGQECCRRKTCPDGREGDPPDGEHLRAA